MKENKEAMGLDMLTDYGKRKLLGYAESFRDLSDSFSSMKEEQPEDGSGVEDRQAYLWKRRLRENRSLLAVHLKEMADIMNQVAEESFRMMNLSEKRKKAIVHTFKEQGILLSNIFIIENDNAKLQVSVTMRCLKGEAITMDEVANFLSVIFDVRLVPEKNSIFFLKKEFETVIFEEEAKYGVLTGVAKAIKENETVSGDNYTFAEVKNGIMLMALSDGMGSGDKACSDSVAVIELLEKLMESGFSPNAAVEMINGSLIAKAEEQNMSTLDICNVDLFTGKCELLKIGSSYTYIKKDDFVELIPSNTLPMGIFYHVDAKSSIRQLEEGDYIIMLSDGVVDCLDGENKEELLREVIGMIESRNSNEIANKILQFAIRQSKGRIKDDMTILVMGLWENY